jgi:hypothetical protein
MTTWCSRCTGGLLVVALATGCFGKPEPKPVPVKGRLMRADGKPFAKVVVITFYPTEEGSGRRISPATAVTDGTDGSFSLQCVPGKFKVTLSTVALGHGNPAGGANAPPREAPKPEDDGIPLDYRSQDRSPLEEIIPEGGKEDVVLVIR